MIYSIESGSFKKGEWIVEWSIEFNSFEGAKMNMGILCDSIFKYANIHKDLNSQFRMVDDSCKKPVRIYHYVTQAHPKLSLFSKKL